MGVSLNPNARWTHTIATDLVLPVSYCGWVRVDADRNDFTTICWLGDDTTANHAVLLALNSDGVSPILFDDNFDTDVTAAALSVGTWYFVAATAAAGAGNLRLYVVAVGGTLALTDSATWGGTFDGELIGIGGGRPDAETAALNADASFSMWRFWTAALSLAELQAEMASVTPVRTANLFRAYRFADAATATVDSSGNGGDLTATAGTGSFVDTDDPDLGGGTDVTGAASLSGGGLLAATGQRGVAGASALAGGGTLAAAGVRGTAGQAALSGGGSLAASGVRGRLGTGTLGGGSALTSSGVRGVVGAAGLAAGGSLAAQGVRSTAGLASLSGGGSLSAAGVRGVTGAGSLAGGGSLTASGTVEGVVTGTATLSGGGTLTASGLRAVVAAAVLVAGGTLAASGRRGVAGAAVLSGGGSLTAAGSTPASADPNPTIVRIRDGGRGSLADRPIQRLREPA